MKKYERMLASLLVAVLILSVVSTLFDLPFMGPILIILVLTAVRKNCSFQDAGIIMFCASIIAFIPTNVYLTRLLSEHVFRYESSLLTFLFRAVAHYVLTVIEVIITEVIVNLIVDDEETENKME